MAFTYFFRDTETLQAALDCARSAFQGRRHIDVWDAGSATGQEPFTVAILLREMLGSAAFKNVRIWATDIDEGNNCEAFINAGVYPEDQVKRIPEHLLRSYFESISDKTGYFRLIEEIRSSVRFIRSDLLELVPPRDNFSLIVCKNVLLHFSASEKCKVLEMFYKALTDDGYLVTEAVQQLPNEISETLFKTVPGHNGVHMRLSKGSIGSDYLRTAAR